MNLDGDALRTHRLLLTGLARAGYLTWREFNGLMKDIQRQERRLICRSKERFASYYLAQRAVARIRNSHVDHAWLPEIRKCTVCNGFHLFDDGEIKRAMKRYA